MGDEPTGQGRASLPVELGWAGGDQPLIRVMALHALTYCERLFYLEEVEEIRVADEAVFSGRELHEVLADEDPSGTVARNFELASQRLGLIGRVDAFRRRDGSWVPYEHKRGRSAPGRGGAAGPWPSDRVQVAAYALLLEEHVGEPVAEGRVRYHASGVTVRIPISEALRAEVYVAVERCRKLRRSTARPPVTGNARLCLRCSLAPVCLPEESRLAASAQWRPVRLFPPDVDGTIVHVLTPGTTVSRSGDCLVLHGKDVEERRIPIREIRALVVHGYGQVTTQALHLCGYHDVAVHWLTLGGRYVAGVTAGSGRTQRRIRQYEALSHAQFALRLARRLAQARVSSQLRFVLRATRGREEKRAAVTGAILEMRRQLQRLNIAEEPAIVRGHEGAAGMAYFRALPELIEANVDQRLRLVGRSRRPPRDRFNAILSFLYSLLFREVHAAVMAVGLEPAFGFFHTPRSESPPLVLVLMELFRVPTCDMSLIASLNRRQWQPTEDFVIARDHVWLSDSGRRRAIDIFECRLDDVWRNPSTGYSLSYRRAIEFEVRLLEKEWSGEPGLFARARLR